MVQVVRVRRRIALSQGEPKKLALQGRPMSRLEIADEIGRIKVRQRLLRPPMSTKPTAFHEDKDDIRRMLERLEDAVRFNRPLRAD